MSKEEDARARASMQRAEQNRKALLPTRVVQKAMKNIVENKKSR
jgi:hypothetical protein